MIGRREWRRGEEADPHQQPQEGDADMLAGWLKRYAPVTIRQAVWNREFSRGQWERLTQTTDDYLYPCIQAHLRGGALLDLGCGHGTTASELPPGSYSAYVGVDLSAVAIARAAHAPGASYVVGDILTYRPDRTFDVILFRESLYYVPLPQIPALLTRYLAALTPTGRILVRVWHRTEHRTLIDRLRDTGHVEIEHPHPRSHATIVVLR
jgi:SAM-dependent methyltransferase